MHWSFGKDWETPELWRSSKSWHVSSDDIKKKKIWCVNITMHLTRKTFKYWEAVNLLKFFFAWKLALYHYRQNTGSCFIWSDRLTLFIFEKPTARYLSLNNQGLPFFSSKKWCSNKKSSRLTTITHMLFIHQCTAS